MGLQAKEKTEGLEALKKGDWMPVVKGKARVQRKRRGAYHHGDLRATLIDAAARVAARDGVEAIQLRMLAKQAGVSPSAPFRHFATLEALLVAVAEEGLRRVLEQRQAVATEVAAGGSDAVERERAFAIASVRFAVEEPGYFRVMHRPDVIRRSRLLQVAIKQNRDTMNALLEPTQPGQRAKELTGRAAGTLAAQALIYGLARMILDGLLGEKVDGAMAAQLAWELTGVLGEGLAGGRG